MVSWRWDRQPESIFVYKLYYGRKWHCQVFTQHHFSVKLFDISVIDENLHPSQGPKARLSWTGASGMTFNTHLMLQQRCLIPRHNCRVRSLTLSNFWTQTLSTFHCMYWNLNHHVPETSRQVPVFSSCYYVITIYTQICLELHMVLQLPQTTSCPVEISQSHR
jgi:hypothetical protein